MSQTCKICSKKPQTGNTVSHANNKGKRRWKLNLKRVRAFYENKVQTIRVCTRCLRSGKVQKAA